MLKVKIRPRFFSESTFDAAGRLAASTNVAGRPTKYFYDPVGRLTNTVFADNTASTTEYDAAGRIIGTRDRLRLGTWYAYDEAGRRTFVTNSDFKVSEYRYDKIGNLKEFINPLQRTTHYDYDGQNRLTRTTYPDWTYSLAVYDGAGQRIEEINQEGVSTHYDYDDLGRLTAAIAPYKLYDMSGAQPVESEPNPGDQTITRYKYDEIGNLIEQLDGNQSVLPEPQQRPTKFEYDEFRRRTKRTLPGGQYEEFKYNEIGNLQTHIDFNRKTTKFEYDSNGRLMKKIPDDSFQSDPVVFTYLADGRRASMKYPIGPNAGSEQINYEYEGERLSKKIAAQGTIFYEYTDDGNLSSVATSHGTAVSYDYDALNRLKAVHAGTASTGYAYDDNGNLKTVTLPNQIVTTYNYNDLDHLTDLVSVLYGETVASFNYNPAEPDRILGPTGNRRAAREVINCTPSVSIHRNINYDYDTLYRLTKEEIVLGSGNTAAGMAAGSILYDAAPGYTDLEMGSGYDRVGNRHSRTLQNANTTLQNKISQFTRRDYDLNDRVSGDSYDDNGNTRRGEIQPAQRGDDVYDCENRLIKRLTTLTIDGQPRPVIISCVYDGDGNRIRKTVSDTEYNLLSATDYLVDDRSPTGFAEVLEELEALDGGEFAPKRRFVYGHDLISQTVEPGGWTSYYGYDGHGNVRYLTRDSGEVTDACDYDAFGVQLTDWHRGTATPNDYFFSGERYDADLGFYYLRARYYRPELGRFWTMDTYEGSQGDPLSLHKYLYAADNPANLIDPSGHEGTYLSLMTSSTISASLSSMYNGVVSGVGSAMQATLFGVQAGQSMNEILTGFVLDETGIGLGVDAYQAMKSYFQTEEEKSMAAYMLWREDLIATILASMEDDEFGEIRVELVPQCFLPGTPVATESGLKSIEEIKPGDKVWTWNEATEEVALRPVLDCFIHQCNEIFEIMVGCDTLKVTGEHPFYVSSKGWIPAREVEIGDQLVTSDNRMLDIHSVAKQSGEFLVYNFEVSTDHNYYVGEEEILTHNMNALRAAMKLKNPLLAAHHIVALRAKGAKLCRDLLLAPGTGIINLNDIRNGVPLPRNLKVRVPQYANASVHSVMHTTKYWTELENRLAAVAPGQRIKVLSQAANELLLGKFPYK